MTSSQPIITPQAVNFTPDNMHFYAYSGIKASSATPTNFIDFHTQSYYLVGHWQPTYLGDSTNNIRYDIQINGILVAGTEVTASRDYAPYVKLQIIIPPFSHVEIIIDNLSGGTNTAGVVLMGRVYGMTETEYQ